MPTCNDCKHFFPTENQTGLCRRYPPQILLVENEGQPTARGGGQVLVSQFPRMAKEGFCGEHISKLTL